MALADDTVEFRLYPLLDDVKTTTEFKELLQTLADEYLASMCSELIGYIWQKSPLRFNVLPEITSFGPPHIFGTIAYGDNIEDEWFLVYLLINLSKAYPELIVKINDIDGEFLLIEAANNLPKWLHPDTALNRVFICQGKLHVVPISKEGGPVKSIAVAEAIDIIKNPNIVTVANACVQSDIQSRISVFPAQIELHQHFAHCFIPAPLAVILEKFPQLISTVVEAFCNIDSSTQKKCVTMDYFRPGTRIMRRIKFTRCLYAKLIQKRYQPDRRSGWNLPSNSNPKFKAYDLGMKLAHGAEIMCSDASKYMKKDDECSMHNDVRWNKFLSNLQMNGYFRNELEGSKLYKELNDEAFQYFKSSFELESKLLSDVNDKLFDIYNSSSYDLEKMRKEETEIIPEDDDSWLDINEQDLEELMSKYCGKTVKADSDILSQNLNGFVNTQSSFEGVENKRESAEIQFDSNGIIQSMQKMFDFEDDDDGSSSDLNEYSSDEDIDEGCKKRTKPQKNSNNMDIDKYMEMMDRELSKTNIGKDFIKKNEKSCSNENKKYKSKGNVYFDSDDDNIDDEDDEFKPIDVDLNLVNNLLASYNSQGGGPGPASNIVGSMGMEMPKVKPK